MSSTQKQRAILITLFLLTISTALYLIVTNFQQNILFFQTPSAAKKLAPSEQEFRLGGMVVADSISYSQNGLQVQFSLTDFSSTIEVSYRGILPDLFREEQGIIATGKLQSGIFIATELLAKHDENYLPPELKDIHPEGTVAK